MNMSIVEYAVRKGRTYKTYEGENWLECVEPEAMDCVLQALCEQWDRSFSEARETVCFLLEKIDGEKTQGAELKKSAD